MQQFFGKHLLMILLVIALGGAISIAAVPQLRGPVTDYIGENFGPKADSNSNLISISNDFFDFIVNKQFDIEKQGFSEIFKTGQPLVITFKSHNPNKKVETSVEPIPTCELMYAPGDYQKNEYPCVPNLVTINLPVTFNKYDLESGNIIIRPYVTFTDGTVTLKYQNQIVYELKPNLYDLLINKKESLLYDVPSDLQFDQVSWGGDFGTEDKKIEIKSLPRLREKSELVSFKTNEPVEVAAKEISSREEPFQQIHTQAEVNQNSDLLKKIKTCKYKEEINKDTGLIERYVINDIKPEQYLIRSGNCAARWGELDKNTRERINFEYATIPTTISDDDSLSIKPISYLRFDEKLQKDVEHILPGYNDDVHKEQNIYTFQPGDKINFEALIARMSTDQNDIVIELSLPYVTEKNDTGEVKKYLANYVSQKQDQENSRFNYDETNHRLVWNYTRTDTKDNTIKKDQDIKETFQLQIAETTDIDFDRLGVESINIQSRQMDNKVYYDLLKNEVARIASQTYQIRKQEVLATLARNTFNIKETNDKSKLQSYINDNSEFNRLSAAQKILFINDLAKSIETVDKFYNNKISKSNSVNFNIITSRLVIKSQDESVADGITPSLIEVKIDNSDGKFKQPPIFDFNIDKMDKSVKIKVNKDGNPISWEHEDSNWQDDTTVTGKMFKSGTDYVQYVALKSNVPDAIEMIATLKDDSGTQFTAKARTTFTPSYSKPQFYIIRDGQSEPQLINEVGLNFSKISGGLWSFEKFKSEDILMISESKSNFTDEKITSRISFNQKPYYAVKPVKLVEGKNILAKFNLIIDYFTGIERRTDVIDFTKSSLPDQNSNILNLDFALSQSSLSETLPKDNIKNVIRIAAAGDFLNPAADSNIISHFVENNIAIYNQVNYADFFVANLDEITDLHSVINNVNNKLSLSVNVYSASLPIITPVNIIQTNLSRKEITTNWDGKNLDNNEVYPGDRLTLKINPNVGANFTKLKTELHISEFADPVPDTLGENAEYDKEQHIITWQYNKDNYEPNKEEVLELKLNNNIPVNTVKDGLKKENKNLILSAKNFIDDLPLTISDEEGNIFSSTNTEIAIWGKVRGQLTGPYALNNGVFQLSNTDNIQNRYLPYMDISLLNEKNKKISKNYKDYNFNLTDGNGNYELKYNRKNLTGGNEVKFNLKYILYNPNVYDSNNTIFNGSDGILVQTKDKVSNNVYEIVTSSFAINETTNLNDIYTNIDFPIRQNQKLTLDWEKPNSSDQSQKEVVEAQKTLTDMMVNLYKAMLITRGNYQKYYPNSPIEYKTISLLIEAKAAGNYGGLSDGNDIIFPIKVFNGDFNPGLTLLPIKYPVFELHEFTHYLDDIVGHNSWLSDPGRGCAHCGYTNSSTADSLGEGFAIFYSSYLFNKLVGNESDNWKPFSFSPYGAAYSLNGILPFFGSLFFDENFIINPRVTTESNEDSGVARLLNLLISGARKTNYIDIKNGKIIDWFDNSNIPNVIFGPLKKQSVEDIDQNVAKLLYLFKTKNPANMYELLNAANNLGYWQDDPTKSGFKFIEQIYAIDGVFYDKDGDWKWDWSDTNEEEIGRAANTASFKGYTGDFLNILKTFESRPDRKILSPIANANIKLSFNQPNVSDEDYSTYHVTVVSDNPDIDASVYEYNGAISDRYDLAYLPPILNPSTIFINFQKSKEYIRLRSDTLNNAIKAANANNTGVGYVAEANFNIQPADPDKGIEAATPPTLEQMQAMEVEKEKIKQAEIDKALAAQKAQEEADRLQKEKEEQEKALALAQEAQAKADLQTELDKLTQEKTEAEEKARQAEEARLKALEELRIAQQKELDAQEAQLKAEQEKAIELAKLEADKQAEIEKNQHLAEENTKLQAKLTSYEKQINDLEAQLAKTQQDLANARIEKDDILNEKNKLISDLSKAKEDNQVLHQISLNLRQSALSLEEQLKNLNIAYISQKESYQQDKLNDLTQKKNLLELTDINSETKKQLEEQLSLTSDLTQQNSDLTNQIESKNDQIAKSQLTITKLQSDLTQTQNNLTNIQSQKDNLLKENNDLKVKLQQAKDDHNIIQEINLTLQKTVSDLEIKLKDSQLLEAQRNEELRLEKIQNELLKQANQQKELANLELQEELKAKELALQNQQTQEQVTLEQDKQDELNNESQTKLDNLDDQITKTQNELTQITNSINDSIANTPLITIKPVESTTSSNDQLIQTDQTQREDIKISTTKDDLTHLSGISSQTITNKPIKLKTNDQIIVNTDNFNNTDNLKVYLDDTQIAQTPIITPQTDLKITIPTKTSLGSHTITVKDDLGNQAQETIKVDQNEMWNTTNLGMGASGLLAILIIGYVVLVVSKSLGLTGLPFVSILLTIGFSSTLFIYLLNPQSIIANNRSAVEIQSLNKDNMENVNGFIRMPDSSGSYYSNVTGLDWGNKWAKPETICFVQRLAKEWYNSNPDNPLAIGRLSSADNKEVTQVSSGYDYKGLGVDLVDTKRLIIQNDIGSNNSYVKKGELENLVKSVAQQMFKTIPEIRNIDGYIHIKLNK